MFERIIAEIITRFPHMLWPLVGLLVFLLLKWTEQRIRNSERENYKEKIETLVSHKNLLKEEREELARRMADYADITHEKERALIIKDQIIENTQITALQMLTETQKYQARIEELETTLTKTRHAVFALDWMLQRQEFVSRYVFSVLHNSRPTEGKERILDFFNKTFNEINEINFRNSAIKNKMFNITNMEYSEKLLTVLSEEYLRLPIEEEIALIENIEKMYTNYANDIETTTTSSEEPTEQC